MLNELNICNIDPQSYLLLKEGLKSVIRVGHTKPGLEDVKKYAHKLGLKLIIKEFKEMYGGVLEKPVIMIYYSSDKELCRKAWKAEKRGDRKTFGKLLGYPECCVDNFIENHKNDLTLISLRNVKTKPSFYCNNLFVFDSKLRSFDLPIYYNNFKIFESQNVKDLFLIRHVPCSFDCKKSVNIGKSTLKLLEDNFPDLAKRIVDALKRPVLYWNYFEWVILKGHQEGDIIKYDGILDYESLIKKEIKNMIGKGNDIKITDGKMTVLKNKEKIEKISRKDGIPVCIDFQ